MSLPRPPNRKPFFGPTLIGACTGMILCIPLAAYTAAALGDDYNTRALIYCGFLLWCIVGAVVLFMKTWQSENQKISPASLKTVESTLSQIRRRRARGTSGLWPSSP